MLKHLLSLAAVAAISLSANANLNILGSFGSSGWNSSYDADTKTITYEGAWTGRGWWLDGADYSDYESLVIKFAEPLAAYAQIVCEYTEEDADGENSGTAGASAGATEVEYIFDNDRKSSINQIYLQASEAGTIVLSEAYLTEPDGSTEKVLFEGEQGVDWYPGIEIAKTQVIGAGAGSKLVAEVSSWAEDKDGWSVKLGISWTGKVLPSFLELEGINEEYSTLWVTSKSWSYTFTAEDIKALEEDGDNNLHFCSEATTILNKLTLVKPSDSSNSNQTAVSSIAVEEENAPVEYFNLQGVRVANPQNGLFIKRQGSKATKVFVK